jgi:hypothetical protein
MKIRQADLIGIRLESGLVEMAFDLAALALRAPHRGCERLPSPTERSLSPGRDSGRPSQQPESTPMLQKRARPDSNGSIPIAYPDGAGDLHCFGIYNGILRNAGCPHANGFDGQFLHDVDKWQHAYY